jgi:hypothetical protein
VGLGCEDMRDEVDGREGLQKELRRSSRGVLDCSFDSEGSVKINKYNTAGLLESTGSIN